MSYGGRFNLIRFNLRSVSQAIDKLEKLQQSGDERLREPIPVVIEQNVKDLDYVFDNEPKARQYMSNTPMDAKDLSTLIVNLIVIFSFIKDNEIPEHILAKIFALYEWVITYLR